MSFQPALIVFGRGQIIRRLVRPDLVIGLIPLLQLSVVLFESYPDVFNLIKLFPVGPVCPLHVALQLRASRWNDKEPDPVCPAGLLKVLLELRPAIDLDGPDREGELLFHILQEQGRGEARGMPIGPGYVPSGYQVPGAELPAAIVALEADL